MKSNFLLGPLLGLRNHAPLIYRMIKREVIGRYRGSFLGIFWSFVHPVLMLSIYTFVFGVVFKARWGDQAPDDQLHFAAILFSGLIVFNLFSECLSSAPHLIVNNPNYVKKVIFPLDILPWVTLGSAAFHAVVSLVVLLLFLLSLGHAFSWLAGLLPLILLPFFFLILGLSWLLASLGVMIRDIAQVIGMALTAMLFMSPIFYPLDALPPEIAQYLYLNPLTLIVEQTRNVLIWNQLPDWQALGWYYLIAVLFAWLGWIWFTKTRKGFADVL